MALTGVMENVQVSSHGFLFLRSELVTGMVPLQACHPSYSMEFYTKVLVFRGVRVGYSTCSNGTLANRPRARTRT